LIANAVEDAAFHYAPDAPPLRGPGLEQLLRDYQQALDQIERLSHRFDPNVLSALLDLPPLSLATFADARVLSAWGAKLQLRLASQGLGKPKYQVTTTAQAGEVPGQVQVARIHHGLSSIQTWPSAFFGGAEYAVVAEVAKTLHELVQPGARVTRGNRSSATANFHQAQAWLMDEAKRGRTIQRFKGLGEMNPEQLWETTVNPDTRRLLQVRIEDAVAADQIFSTLMGDVVEPRREFIEQNALRVSNLDV
jgi:DNA gyrase subunit B